MLLFLLGCIGGDGPDSETGTITLTGTKTGTGSFDCTEVAIKDVLGEPDACDVAACEMCQDNCGDSCMIQESYPPGYACQQGGTWSVYDQCPSWQPPSSPYAVDIVDLGCGYDSTETLTASSTSAGRIDVQHTDYIGGCCPQDVRIDVVQEDSTLNVSYSLVNDLCDCYCLLDATYALVEVPSGTWTLNAGSGGMSTTVTVP